MFSLLYLRLEPFLAKVTQMIRMFCVFHLIHEEIRRLDRQRPVGHMDRQNFVQQID